MSKNIVHLLLGTNLGNKNNNLELAKSFINKEIGEIVKVSNILENDAEGFTSSNSFLNQKIMVETSLSPLKLLYVIKDIEYKIGRVYEKPLENEKFIDRIIDIDILLFNKINFKSSLLTIPHHQIYTRKFFLNLLYN